MEVTRREQKNVPHKLSNQVKYNWTLILVLKNDGNDEDMTYYYDDGLLIMMMVPKTMLASQPVVMIVMASQPMVMIVMASQPG